MAELISSLTLEDLAEVVTNAAERHDEVVDETLCHADVRAYRRAAKILKRARAAALAATELDLFDDHVQRIREQYRRRPSLIGILDRAGFA